MVSASAKSAGKEEHKVSIISWQLLSLESQKLNGTSSASLHGRAGIKISLLHLQRPGEATEALRPGPSDGIWQWWPVMVKVQTAIITVTLYMTFHNPGLDIWLCSSPPSLGCPAVSADHLVSRHPILHKDSIHRCAQGTYRSGFASSPTVLLSGMAVTDHTV